MQDNNPEEQVYEGTVLGDGVGINWRTYKLAGLDTARHQAAGVEAIRAARHEAMVANSEQLAEVGIAKLVRYAQFAHHVAQVEPELCPFLREVNEDLKTIVRNSLYRYNQEKRD